MISLSLHTLAGTLVGTLTRGWQPGPWCMFKVKTVAVVNDRFGNRTEVSMTERAVIIGELNIKAALPHLREGREFLIIGQRVPAYTVMGDAVPPAAGIITSAAIFQPAQEV